MAPSSTAPMQSSNTGIKSARKSAWILKSSLPPLTEDAQSTCWRSWSLNSQTGSVRKPSFFSSLHLVYHLRSHRVQSSYHYLLLACCREANGLSGRSIRCSLSNPPTRGNHLSITVQTCCHRVVYLRRTRAWWNDRISPPERYTCLSMLFAKVHPHRNPQLCL
jgi:hypothetical protein